MLPVPSNFLGDFASSTALLFSGVSGWIVPILAILIVFVGAGWIIGMLKP